MNRRVVITDTYENHFVGKDFFVISTQKTIRDKYLRSDTEAIYLYDSKLYSEKETQIAIDAINRGIDECCIFENAKYMYWHIFQSHDTRNVRTVVFVNLLFREILKRGQIDTIYIKESADNKYLSDAAFFWGKTYGIKVTRRANSFQKRIACLVRNHFVLLARIVWMFRRYKLLNKMLIVARNADKNGREYNTGEYEIGYLLDTDRVTHFQMTMKDAEHFIDRAKGYKIICLFAPDNCRKLNQKGVSADNMEDWLDRSVLYKKVNEYKNYLKRALKIFNGHMNIEKYYMLAFRFMLLEHFYYHAYENYLYDAIFESYYLFNHFKKFTFDGWSWPRQEWGAYIYKGSNTKIYGKVSYMVVGGMKWVDPFPEIYDEIFIPQIGTDYKRRYDAIKKAVKYISIKSENYYATWKDHYEQRKTDYYSAKKRIEVLYAPSGAKFDYYRTDDDFINKTIDIIASKNIKLYVKLHPDEGAMTITKTRQHINLLGEKVQYIEKGESIDNYIKNCDLVITDLSTLIMQAVSMRKAVIADVSSFIIPPEFVVDLRRLACVAATEEELREYMDAILTSPHSLFEWADQEIAFQDKYFLDREKNDGYDFWNYVLEAETKEEIV